MAKHVAKTKHKRFVASLSTSTRIFTRKKSDVSNCLRSTHCVANSNHGNIWWNVCDEPLGKVNDDPNKDDNMFLLVHKNHKELYHNTPCYVETIMALQPIHHTGEVLLGNDNEHNKCIKRILHVATIAENVLSVRQIV